MLLNIPIDCANYICKFLYYKDIYCFSLSNSYFITLLDNINYAMHNDYPIRESCRYGYTAAVKKLLSISYVDPTQIYGQCIIDSARFNYVKILSLLLHDQRIINNPICINTAFNAAVDHSAYDCVKLLLSSQLFIPNRSNREIIIHACKNNNTKMVNILISSPKYRGIGISSSLLESAAKYNRVQILELVINLYNSLKLQIDVGHSLVKAVRYNNNAAAILLLQYTTSQFEILLTSNTLNLDPVIFLPSFAVKLYGRTSNFNLYLLFLSKNIHFAFANLNSFSENGLNSPVHIVSNALTCD